MSLYGPYSQVMDIHYGDGIGVDESEGPNFCSSQGPSGG